jgi:hypothetical protein
MARGGAKTLESCSPRISGFQQDAQRKDMAKTFVKESVSETILNLAKT